MKKSSFSKPHFLSRGSTLRMVADAKWGKKWQFYGFKRENGLFSANFRHFSPESTVFAIFGAKRVRLAVRGRLNLYNER
ncbi:MAG: hypothetical protein EOM20_03085 [Spartobacteria bacterium]|nr:hypothetical protein [Spartobacteria bacterium]